MNTASKYILTVSRTPEGALDFHIEGANGLWPVKKYRSIDLIRLGDEMTFAEGDKQDALLLEMTECRGICHFPCCIGPEGLRVVPDTARYNRVEDGIIVGYLTSTIKRILGDGVEIAVVHAAPFDIVEVCPWLMPLS